MVCQIFSKKSTVLKKSAKHAQPMRSKTRVIMMKSDLSGNFVVKPIEILARQKWDGRQL